VETQFACHLEQALFAQRKPALSEVEGDLGEPRGVSRFCDTINRAFGSLPLSNCRYQKIGVPFLR
jgi:hypothetical protein